LRGRHDFTTLAGSFAVAGLIRSDERLHAFPCRTGASGAADRPRWEYKTINLDAIQCSDEGLVTKSLNAAGNDSWELVSYERLSNLFPRDAEGTLLIRPAATGPGKEHTPQTADSFQGTMTMKMAPMQPGACRFLFKRLAPVAVKR
jgi:hypothetical protein